MQPRVAPRLLAVLAVAFAPAAAAAPALVPHPVEIAAGQGAFPLAHGVTITIPAGDAEAEAAATALRDVLARAPGVKARLVHGTAPPGAPAIAFRRTPGPADDEAYRVTVAPSGVEISAAGRAGLFYGAMTVWQLAIQPAEAGKPALPAVTIADAPRYRWRGLMVDSARHFQTVAELERIIDAMAAYKLNVLHWHLTDDQGWRLQIKAYPRLTQVGAWRAPKGADGSHPGTPAPPRYGGFYTQDDVRRLVAYASARNVTIVPEIELPGHATAALTAYPEFGVTGRPPTSGMSDWGVYANLFSVEEKTFAFLRTVLDEVMDLFPSRYIHIGGDEAIKDQWQASAATQARRRELGLEDDEALQSWFIGHIAEHLAARGRRLVGWDEVLEGDPAPNSVVMSWRGVDGARTAARLGHDTVLTPHPELYLDSRQSLSPREPAGRGELSTLRTVYDFEPAAAGIPGEQQDRILGVQANAFTEHMRDARRLQEMTFPRLVALAEVGWTPQARRDWSRFSAGLQVPLAQLRSLGMAYDAIPFEPHLRLERTGGGLSAALASPLGVGEIRYTTDGAEPSARSPVYAAPLALPEGAQLAARTFLDGVPLGETQRFAVTAAALTRRASSDLSPCGDSVLLRLEDDGPSPPPRPVFAINNYRPCWVWPAVDLSRGAQLTARIGQVPFNFQLAGGRRIVELGRPLATPHGELVVRRRTTQGAVCEGDLLAIAPITRAMHEAAGLVSVSARIPPVAGAHDLCLAFNRPRQEMLWAIDEVQLTPGS